MENVRVVKRLSDEGHEIVFMTSRTEEFLEKFRQFLAEQEIRCKTILSGCFHGKRIVINDFAPSNPFPSCEAVAIRRNDLLGITCVSSREALDESCVMFARCGGPPLHQQTTAHLDRGC